MTGYTETVDFTLLDGAGLNCTRTKVGPHGYDVRFADWVMVRRGISKRDSVDKAHRIAKVQREYGAISNAQDAEKVAALIIASTYEASSKRHKLFAVEDWCDYLGFKVKFRKPTANRRCPHFLTQDQLRTLIHAVQDYRDYAVISTFIFTGARLNEVHNLNLSDVSFATNTILLRNTKNSRDRTIPLSPGLGAVLREYVYRRGVSSKSGDSPLFLSNRGDRLSRRRIQTIVGDVAERAGLPHVHVHMLRHSFASAWIANGGDVFHLQRLLGHQDVAMTMIYLHTDTQTIRRVYESAMPRL